MNNDPNSNSMDQDEETIQRPDDIETGMPDKEEEGDGRDKDPATDEPDSTDEVM